MTSYSIFKSSSASFIILLILKDSRILSSSWCAEASSCSACLWAYFLCSSGPTAKIHMLPTSMQLLQGWPPPPHWASQLLRSLSNISNFHVPSAFAPYKPHKHSIASCALREAGSAWRCYQGRKMRGRARTWGRQVASYYRANRAVKSPGSSKNPWLWDCLYFLLLSCDASWWYQRQFPPLRVIG